VGAATPNENAPNAQAVPDAARIGGTISAVGDSTQI